MSLNLGRMGPQANDVAIISWVGAEKAATMRVRFFINSNPKP